MKQKLNVYTLIKITFHISLNNLIIWYFFYHKNNKMETWRRYTEKKPLKIFKYKTSLENVTILWTKLKRTRLWWDADMISS